MDNKKDDNKTHDEITFEKFLPFWENNLSKTITKIRYGRSIFGLLNIFNNKTPAVVIGAGPSLDKNIGILTKHKNRAVTICCDIVYKKIADYFFEPDICATIDANPEVGNFFKGMKYTNTLLVAPTVTSNEVLTEWKGNRAFYNIQYGNDYCMNIDRNKNFSINTWLPTGNIVFNFSVILAFAMGCKPIIMVGNDLSYPKFKAYSKLTSRRSAINSNKFNTLETINFFHIFNQHGLTVTKDIYGRDILTKDSYIYFHNWLIDNLYKKTRIANCTEGGIAQAYMTEKLEPFLSPYPEINKPYFYKLTKQNKKTANQRFYL